MLEQKIINKTLFGFMNSHLDTGDGGISGGDMAFIQIFQRLKFLSKVIMTPASGENICKSNGLHGEFHNTSHERIHGNVPITWLKRTIKAIMIIPKVGEGDVLYLASDFFVDVIPGLFCKIRQPKSIWIQSIFHLIESPFKRQGSFFINLSSFIIQRLSFAIIRRMADLIIVDSPLIKKKLQNIGFNENRIHVGYVGTDINFIKNIQVNSVADYDAYFMGRFHRSKGVYDLIDIWKNVVQCKPERKLAIIGSISEKHKLEYLDLLRKSKLENNIFLLGFLDKRKAISYIKSGKIFVFPSHEEGFGIVIAESMACGKPVVAWDLEVYHELYGESMIRVAKWNTEYFASKCIELFENENLYNALREKGLLTSSSYDWNSIARRNEEAILKVMRNTSADI